MCARSSPASSTTTLSSSRRYGSNTVCGHARIDGRAVGLLGNNGPIFPQGSVKAAQFIQLCQQSNTPLVFLMNTTGYMVGETAEQSGAVKHGAKMIQAVANTTVPKITIVLGPAGQLRHVWSGLRPRSSAMAHRQGGRDGW